MIVNLLQKLGKSEKIKQLNPIQIVLTAAILFLSAYTLSINRSIFSGEWMVHELLVLKGNNPQLFQRDLFVSIFLEKYPWLAIQFDRILVPLSEHYLIYFGIKSLFVWLFLYFIYKLILLIWADKNIALVSTLFFTVPIYSLDTVSINPYSIIPRSWILCIIPLLLYFYLSKYEDLRRAIMYLIFAGILFNLSPRRALPLVALPFVILLFQKEMSLKKRSYIGVLYFSILGLLMSPSLITSLQLGTNSLSAECISKIIEFRYSYMFLHNQLNVIIYFVIPIIVMAIISLWLKEKNRLDYILIMWGFVIFIGVGILDQMGLSISPTAYLGAHRYFVYVLFIAAMYAFALPVLSYKKIRYEKKYKYILSIGLICIFLIFSVMPHYGISIYGVIPVGNVIYEASESYGDIALLPVYLIYGFNESNVEKWVELHRGGGISQNKFNFKEGPEGVDNMYAWIKRNTPTDSIILANPDSVGMEFYLQTHRGLIVSRKLCPLPYDQKFAVDWYKRYIEMQYAYENANLENLIELGKEYNADYILIDTTRNSFLTGENVKIAHIEGDFILLEV